MSFWNNEKYVDGEKALKSGDFFRGVPARNFPWLLKESLFTDKDHDMWKIKVICKKVDMQDFSQNVTAYIELEALCTLSNENLQKIGAHSERLNDLGFSGWHTLSEKCSLNFSCPLEKIHEKSAPLLDIFFKKVQEKYNLMRKEQIVKHNIKSCQINNFN